MDDYECCSLKPVKKIQLRGEFVLVWNAVIPGPSAILRCYNKALASEIDIEVLNSLYSLITLIFPQIT